MKAQMFFPSKGWVGSHLGPAQNLTEALRLTEAKAEASSKPTRLLDDNENVIETFDPAQQLSGPYEIELWTYNNGWVPTAASRRLWRERSEHDLERARHLALMLHNESSQPTRVVARVTTERGTVSEAMAIYDFFAELPPNAFEASPPAETSVMDELEEVMEMIPAPTVSTPAAEVEPEKPTDHVQEVEEMLKAEAEGEEVPF